MQGWQKTELRGETMERAHGSTAQNESLRTARLEKEWTIEQAAEYVGVDPTTIERWESGETFPQPVKLRKLCRVYEKKPEELGFGEKPPRISAKSAPLVVPSRPMIFWLIGFCCVLRGFLEAVHENEKSELIVFDFPRNDEDPQQIPILPLHVHG
jgi:transcriptional regulator with XRE-family HTH domain